MKDKASAIFELIGEVMQAIGDIIFAILSGLS